MHDSSLDFLTPDKQRTNSTHELIDGIVTLVREKNLSGLIHPHGFYVLPLCSDDFSNWRLHIWPKGPRQISGMPTYIHTHDVDISSRILIGQLVNEIFDVSETKTNGMPLYEVAYYGDKYSANTQNLLRNTNKRVKTKRVNEEVLRAGDFYFIEAHKFHQATVGENAVTATLAHMHNRSPGAVRVVGLDGYSDEISFKRQPCSGSDIIEILQTI